MGDLLEAGGLIVVAMLSSPVGILYLLLGVAVGSAAYQRRGHPIWQGALLGAILGPILGLVLFIGGYARSCAFCKSGLAPGATVCAKCGREQPEPEPELQEED